MPDTRQLTAIMFTDIQGYTAIMQRDEALAIKVRNRHRKIFNSTTEKFHGKILQYFGDGTLSTFKSAIDAVKCAMEMQMAFQNEPVIPVRIGIHIGDIVLREDEIIGDGVNVASRIESLAVPGSVFISDKVYDEIKNHSSIETQSLKTFELKNVDKPIEVFAISNKGLIIPNADEIFGKAKDSKADIEKVRQKKQLKGRTRKLSWILYSMIGLVVLIVTYFAYQNIFHSGPKLEEIDKSIAVLAFTNMSDDPNQEYFSDGISEEILNSLVKVEGLKVAGRTSSFSFKGKDTDIQTIGNKLGVGLVLEGSVRKSGNHIRITVQLINVIDGYHLWSEQYDRELEDIFSIQEEIASNIVNMLKLTLLTYTNHKPPTKSFKAYDFYLKGLYFLSRDVEGTISARNYFLKAIEYDNDFALAYAGLGSAYLNSTAYGLMSGDEGYNKARKAARKSIMLDSKQPLGHRVMANINLLFDWDWEAAKSEYNKALQLGLPNPNQFITWYNAFLCENFEEAIEDSKLIIEREPFSVEAHWNLGLCYFMANQYENAIISFNKLIEVDPSYSLGYRWLGKTYRIIGKYDEAMSSIRKAQGLTGGYGQVYNETILILVSSGQIKKARTLFDEMLDSESEQSILPGTYAKIYTNLGQFDEAFKWLEKCYEERTMTMFMIKTIPDFDTIRDDPRYDDLVKRMNFPEE